MGSTMTYLCEMWMTLHSTSWSGTEHVYIGAVLLEEHRTTIGQPADDVAFQAPDGLNRYPVSQVYRMNLPIIIQHKSRYFANIQRLSD